MSTTTTGANQWGPDILGPDFSAHVLDLGSDPDGEGNVVATLVRHLPEDIDAEAFASRPAILYVHGMSDYFFHRHLAAELTAAGYAFYAIDLRKCGRSHRDGQRWHYVSHIDYYNEDLDAARAVITAAGHPKLIGLGHSTGGLILPLWYDHLQQHGEFSGIAGLILNSPWLDMQFSPALVKAGKLVGPLLAKWQPNRPIPGGNFTAYVESLHQDFHGEWDFDLTLKRPAGNDKYWPWLLDIIASQDRIKQHTIDVGVPTLVLRSDRSYLNKPYSAATDTADVIVDVDQIQQQAAKLGSDITIVAIPGARHDVFLSLPLARKQALDALTAWLSTHGNE
ncbi:MAG: alpha/beta hydrolase [Corynebacterium sp.]|nr:alpha/beta hydrolase [Corynebacterium sp.]